MKCVRPSRKDDNHLTFPGPYPRNARHSPALVREPLKWIAFPGRAGVAAVLTLGLVIAAAGWSPPGAVAGEKEGNLLQQLKKDGVEQRRQALIRLGRHGGEGAVPALVMVLKDFDPVSRALAEQALWSIWMRSGDARVDALLLKGTRLMAEGDLEKAVEAFDRVIRLRPGFAEGYNKRATAMYHLGRFQQSLADIAETLRRNPYHFGALSGAGLCLLGLKRPREAMEFFQRALRINPNMQGIIELNKRVKSQLRKPMT